MQVTDQQSQAKPFQEGIKKGGMGSSFDRMKLGETQEFMLCTALRNGGKYVTKSKFRRIIQSAERLIERGYFYREASDPDTVFRLTDQGKQMAIQFEGRV